MKPHDAVREQLVLWVLGEPTEVPVSQLVDHLAGCPECLHYVHHIEAAVGHLPEALPQKQPPSHVRERVLAFARSHSAAARETRAQVSLDPADFLPPQQPAKGAERRLWGRSNLLRPLWIGGLAVLLASNVFMQGRLADRSAELATLSERYTADVQWLRTAERLLAKEQEPHARATLAAPQEGSSAVGSALVYNAYDDTAYLLIQADGLASAGTIEVWWHGPEQELRLTSFDAPDFGEAIVVYRGNIRLATGWVTLRAAGSGETLLAGTMKGTTPPTDVHYP